MKHKHCELIKAWADGAEIQWRFEDKWIDYADDDSPTWDEDIEYRIKPKEKVVRWQWVVEKDGRIWIPNYFFESEEEVIENYAGSVKVIGKAEWTRMEFDE